MDFVFWQMRSHTAMDRIFKYIGNDHYQIRIPDSNIPWYLSLHGHLDIFLFRPPGIDGQNIADGLIPTDALWLPVLYIFPVLLHISKQFIGFPVPDIFFDQKTMMADIMPDSGRLFL